MNWASEHIKKLGWGDTVSFRPKGASMSGKIESGQLVTVEPATIADVEVGDVVLCKVRGTVYLHLVSAEHGKGTVRRVQISNNKGRVNGWTGTVYGRVTKVES